MYIRLSPPPAIKEERDREVSRVEKFFKTRKLSLDATKRSKLTKTVTRLVEEWEEGTADLQQRLVDLNNLYEGKREEVDFPFGAGQSSTIDIKLAAARSRTLRANFNRVVFADTAPFVSELLPGAKRDGEDNLAEAQVNWSLDKETNGLETLKDTPIPSFRDGTALIHGEWERRIESGVEYLIYENTEQFQADYPDHKAAGVSEQQYAEILDELSLPEAEVHVEYELDFVAQNAPVYTIFPLAKFIWGPLSASDLRTRAELYGYHYNQSGSKFETDAKLGFYDAEPVKECRKRSPAERDSWDSSRDSIDGIDGESQDRASYKIAKLVVCADLNNDKIPERYMVWFDMEAKKILRSERYGLIRNVPNIVPFRLIRRDGRFLGVSLLSDGEDLVRQVNALHRHRSNNRRITDSVTLVLPKRLKEDVDLGAEYAEFKPGMTIWVPDEVPADKYPKQLQIHNLSRTNDSMDEESLLNRYLDGIWGISEGQSGRETPLDPGAPAAKTKMLLQRADLRIEDLVDEWRRSIPDFTELHTALYIQNAGGKVGFVSQSGGKSEDASLRTLALANPKRRFVLKAVKQAVTPEFEMNKIMALVAAAFQMQFPVQANPRMIVEFWNDYVTASRIPLPERFHIQVDGQGGMSMGGSPVEAQNLLATIQAMAANKNGTAERKPQRTKEPAR